jgi:steroid 5-alpha reductase family enzyme
VFSLRLWLEALAAIAPLMALGWLLSLKLRNVSLVDTLWSLMFLLAALCYALLGELHTARSVLILVLVTVWAARLALYIGWRNHGHGEDRRYQQIRARNSPGFEWKSLYLVFALQALLAWFISLPLLAAAHSSAALGPLDVAGVLLWAFGFYFEAVGDAQLARFKADPANRGQVMDRGLWRYTRHPNYFGECCLWWGYYLIAASAGGWWSLPAPLLMSLLLLKVSGVTLLEQDIAERRPGYREYVQRTSAFVPRPPRALHPSTGSPAA